MSDYGNPQADQILPNDQQRNAITAALMGIARPPGKGQLPQLPGRLPTNVSGGMSAIGNAIGGMGQPTPPVAPGPPMSLAPPQAAQQPPPVAPPQPGVPPPQGAPVGAGGPAAMPPPGLNTGAVSQSLGPPPTAPTMAPPQDPLRGIY